MMAIQFTAHQSGKKHQKYLIWYHTGKGNTGRRKHQITWSYFLNIPWTKVKEDDMTGKKASALTKHMEPKLYWSCSASQSTEVFSIIYWMVMLLECNNWIYIHTCTIKKKVSIYPLESMSLSTWVVLLLKTIMSIYNRKISD